MGLSPGLLVCCILTFVANSPTDILIEETVSATNTDRVFDCQAFVGEIALC